MDNSTFQSATRTVNIYSQNNTITSDNEAYSLIAKIRFSIMTNSALCKKKQDFYEVKT